MGLSEGTEFVRDAVLLTTGVPLEFKRSFADPLEGRTRFIKLVSEEFCEAAEDAETVTQFAGYVRVTELRAALQSQASNSGLGDSEADAVLGSFSNALLIAFCPDDFERLYDVPAR